MWWPRSVRGAHRAFTRARQPLPTQTEISRPLPPFTSPGSTHISITSYRRPHQPLALCQNITIHGSFATNATMSAIISFYDPTIKAPFDPHEDQSTLDKALRWSDRTLEYRHDYVQHWFPLPEPSPVNPDAPVITKETRDAFMNRPELRDNLRRAWLRM